MSELRAKAHLLSQPQDGTIGKICNYVCDHALEAALEPGFFDGLRSNLLAGDVVRLIQKDSIADPRKGRVLADAEVMVLEVTSTAVTVAARGGITRYAAPVQAAAGVSAANPPSIRWSAKSQAHEVVSGAGDVLAAFTKDQGGKAAAEAYLDDLTRKAA